VAPYGVLARQGVSFLLAAALHGCAAAPPVRILSSDRVKARPVARAAWVGGWDAAMATALDGIHRELGHPRFRVALHLYRDREAFEAALLASGYPVDFARATARTMAAIGGHGRVLVNEGNLSAVPWEGRLALLAHELTHSLQYELGGGHRGTSDQWLREGFAEWVAVRVLERLDAATLERARYDAVAGVRGRARPLPALDAMATFPQWVALGHGPHADAVYDLAFAAVDFLIRRHGRERAVRYFELFARSQDRAANFRAAFGEDLPAFEAALSEELWPARRSGNVRVQEVDQVLDRDRLVEDRDPGALQLHEQRRVRVGGHHRHR
jgi:hypothetical protein